MNIIITGGTGFVGSNLSKYLEDKGNVVGKLSLRNPEWILNNNADIIIHLAGKAHDTANTSADDEYFKINRDLTIQLFEEFLNSEIRDFIRPYKAEFEKKVLLETMKKDNLIESKVKNRL